MKTEESDTMSPFTILISSIARKDKDIGKHFKDIKTPLKDTKEEIPEKTNKKKRVKIK